MKILVIGADSFLGLKIYQVLSDYYDVIGTQFIKKIPEFQYLDILKKDSIEKLIKGFQPDILIHVAGIADPDLCEKDKILAWNVNVVGTENIVKVCAKYEKKLIFISSNYVFEGSKSTGYDETDSVQPLNFYGKTKAIGESEVKKLKDWLIIRLPKLYGFNNKDDKITFVTEVIKKSRKGEILELNNVHLRYPVLIDDVAKVIHFLIKEKRNGCFHLSSQIPITKFNWAKQIIKIFELPKTKIIPIKQELKNRPLNPKMKNSLKNIHINEIEQGLKIMKKQMDNHESHNFSRRHGNSNGFSYKKDT